MISIFYHPVIRIYYSNEDVKCNHCQNKVENIALVARGWNRNGLQREFIHHPQCYKNESDDRRVIMKVLFKDNVPNGSVPILPIMPQLVNAGYVTDYEDWKGKTIDRTKYAGRESWEGAMIGHSVAGGDFVLDGQVDEALYLEDMKAWKEVKGLEVQK